MNTITADNSLQQSLASLNSLTEIRDEDGRIIGYFSPAADRTSAAYAQAAAHFDPEEMKRRKHSNERGLTTAEVLDHLKSLEQ